MAVPRRSRGGTGSPGVMLSVAVVVALVAVAASGGAASAGTQVKWATAAPGLAQLPGADACYAQREEESENAAALQGRQGD